MKSSPARWHARVTYRTRRGPLIVDHDVEELYELHDLVERGPDWATIENVYVTYSSNRPSVTVEDALEE